MKNVSENHIEAFERGLPVKPEVRREMVTDVWAKTVKKTSRERITKETIQVKAQDMEPVRKALKPTLALSHIA